MDRACSDNHIAETTRRTHQRFQPEIQGMRALSVLAVVWAHAGLPGLSGGFTGVDVFFVISGFLITRLLLTEMAATGRIDLLRFWARRARRLLPNAYATLIGTVLLALILLPGYDPRSLARDITFAALEIVNFHFAAKAVDYFQSEGPASPILHFWSLAVEEQFYIVWPVLLVGIGIAFRQAFALGAMVLLALIWCASCLACILLTDSDQPLAYFGTGTRCWQLATGALLAAGWDSVERLPRRLRGAMAWLGLAAIAASIIFIDESLRYPGAWALLPTLGAAALIAGVEAASPQSPLRRGLSLPVMQWLGARSYSWYLWHWPLLAVPRAAFPGSTYVELIAIPLSLGVACAAYSWIEIPFRTSRLLAVRPLPTLAGAVAALAMVAGAGHLYRPLLPLIDKAAAERIVQIAAASKNSSQADKDKCHLGKKDTRQPDCLYGDVAGVRRAVLFGDSHALHWFEALNPAAAKTGWQLRSWTKSACPSADVSLIYQGNPYIDCALWRSEAMAKLTGPLRPDVVILSNRTARIGNLYDPATGNAVAKHLADEVWREGFRRTIRRFIAAGVAVVVIRDIPRADKDYRTCLLTGGTCGTPRVQALVNTPLDAEVALEFGDGVKLVDFTDVFCDANTCPARRGDMIVYMDDHHLTATYAATFAPEMTGLLQSLAATMPPAPARIQTLKGLVDMPVTSVISAGAFSSEVDTGSRRENATKQRISPVPVQSERKRL